MRIGEFVRTLDTTIDSVRHYEDLGLLRPIRVKKQKHYSSEHVQTFRVIQEFKSVGFTLEDIVLFFQWKESLGCGSESLMREVAEQFETKIGSLDDQIKGLVLRRDRLKETLDELRTVMQQ